MLMPCRIHRVSDASLCRSTSPCSASSNGTSIWTSPESSQRSYKQMSWSVSWLLSCLPAFGEGCLYIGVQRCSELCLCVKMTQEGDPGISVQAPPQQLSAGHQQPTGSIVTEARQRRRASKFDQPAGEPRAADYPSLLPPPPLHSSNAQKPLTQVAAPVQGVSAQASLPLPGPPPAHSVSASESAESMRARAQAVAARFAAAAAAEEGSQAAEAAMPATAQRPAGLQQPAAAASEFEDDADPFKSLPPLPAKSTPLPRPPRPDPAGLSFNSSKADTIPPAAATTAAPSAVPLKPPPHLSGGMWPRPPQPPGGMPHGPPPRPISGPRPPPGPYPAHPPPQHYPSHLQVRQAGCGLSQCLCSDYYFLFFEFSGGPV